MPVAVVSHGQYAQFVSEIGQRTVSLGNAVAVWNRVVGVWGMAGRSACHLPVEAEQLGTASHEVAAGGSLAHEQRVTANVDSAQRGSQAVQPRRVGPREARQPRHHNRRSDVGAHGANTPLIHNLGRQG